MAKHALARSDARGRHAQPGRHRAPRTTTPLASPTPTAAPGASRSLARSAVAAGGLTAGALMMGQLAAPAALAASADDFARLRMCESGGNYRTDTGNGYYGAYQFALGTWRSLGYSGKPSDAAPGTQDEAARRLQARSGWGQWPACSAKLGLGSSHHSSTSTHRASSSSSSSTSSRPVVVKPAGPVILTTDLVGVERADVRDLQTKLTMLGFTLEIDGHYGTETATVVSDFQHTAGIKVDSQVGPQTQKILQAHLAMLAQLMTLAARA